MLKVKTGQSTKANAAEAGREAASYVKDEIKDGIDRKSVV